MTLLLLGGTADARKIATQLHQQHIPLIYSVAGLVRVPNVDCPVVSGGFRQFGGLKKYIAQQQIRAILDVTHPYADTMSSTAACVAAECEIPYWRFHRPEWQASDQDTWHSVKDWTQLLPLLSSKSSVLLTVGQIDQSVIDELADFHRNNHQTQVLRTAVEPKSTLASSMTWVKAIGPFELTDELALMKQHKIDALVTKNSGGSSTVAKLEAARQLNIPVFMLERPPMPSADALFSDLGTCQAFVLNNFPYINKENGHVF